MDSSITVGESTKSFLLFLGGALIGGAAIYGASTALPYSNSLGREVRRARSTGEIKDRSPLRQRKDELPLSGFQADKKMNNQASNTFSAFDDEGDILASLTSRSENPALQYSLTLNSEGIPSDASPAAVSNINNFTTPYEPYTPDISLSGKAPTIPPASCPPPASRSEYVDISYARGGTTVDPMVVDLDPKPKGLVSGSSSGVYVGNNAGVASSHHNSVGSSDKASIASVAKRNNNPNNTTASNSSVVFPPSLNQPTHHIPPPLAFVGIPLSYPLSAPMAAAATVARPRRSRSSASPTSPTPSASSTAPSTELNPFITGGINTHVASVMTKPNAASPALPSPPPYMGVPIHPPPAPISLVASSSNPASPISSPSTHPTSSSPPQLPTAVALANPVHSMAFPASAGGANSVISSFGGGMMTHRNNNHGGNAVICYKGCCNAKPSYDLVNVCDPDQQFLMDIDSDWGALSGERAGVLPLPASFVSTIFSGGSNAGGSGGGGGGERGAIGGGIGTPSDLQNSTSGLHSPPGSILSGSRPSSAQSQSRATALGREGGGGGAGGGGAGAGGGGIPSLRSTTPSSGGGARNSASLNTAVIPHPFPSHNPYSQPSTWSATPLPIAPPFLSSSPPTIGVSTQAAAPANQPGSNKAKAASLSPATSGLYSGGIISTTTNSNNIPMPAAPVPTPSTTNSGPYFLEALFGYGFASEA
eukprot:CAMPEP_0175047416 /NCGR_PEP_ID=MMETSP0052_2-20121109/5581_1 /TAXON_ID=51329 ORGANISM="Polytomella parva, Strain SAG 63-3" /NCGR_SAMPLE_ID=MMETSP0052_2 /ASSEMBLY_ACC=CAM_ASM_000194 /LENGTH=705 /DNA_ID=CAMNT_0016311285 /DNA_START=247 /DNA_END=2361 /DNA_ORIENTATION=-